MISSSLVLALVVLCGALLPQVHGAAWVIAVRYDSKDPSHVQRFRGASNAVTAATATMNFGGDTISLLPFVNASDLTTVARSTSVLMAIDHVRSEDASVHTAASLLGLALLSRTGSADVTAVRISSLIRLEMTTNDEAVAIAQRVATGGVGATKVACFVNSSDPLAARLYAAVSQQLPTYGSTCKYTFDVNALVTDATVVSSDSSCRAVIAFCSTACVTTIASASADRQFGVIVPIVTSSLLVQLDPLAVATSKDALLRINVVSTLPPVVNQNVNTPNSTHALFQRYGQHGLSSQVDNWYGFVMGLAALSSIAFVSPARRSRSNVLLSLAAGWTLPLDTVGTVLDHMGDTCRASPANVYLWQSDATSGGVFSIATFQSIIEKPAVLRQNRCDPMTPQVDAIMIQAMIDDTVLKPFSQDIYATLNDEINVGVGSATPFFIRQWPTDMTTAGPDVMSVSDNIPTSLALVGSPLTATTMRFLLKTSDQLAVIGNFLVDDGWDDDSLVRADRHILFYPPPSWETRAMAAFAASLTGQSVNVYCSRQNSLRGLQFVADVAALTGISNFATLTIISDEDVRPPAPTAGLFVTIFGTATHDTIRYVNEWASRSTANSSYKTVLLTPFVDKSFALANIPAWLQQRYVTPYAPSLGQTPTQVGSALGALIATKRPFAVSKQSFAAAFSSAGAIRAMPSDREERWLTGLDDGCSELACASLSRTTCPIGVNLLVVGNVSVSFPDCVLPSLSSNSQSRLSNVAIGLIVAACVVALLVVVAVTVGCACMSESGHGTNATDHNGAEQIATTLEEEAEEEDGDMHSVSKDSKSKTSSKDQSGSRHSEELLIQRADEGAHVEANSAFFEALVAPITVRRISMLGIPLAYWVVICLNLGSCGTLTTGNIVTGVMKDTYDDFLDAPSKASTARAVLRCANGLVAQRLSAVATTMNDTATANFIARYQFSSSECGASLAQLLSTVDTQTLTSTVDGITRVYPWQSTAPPDDAIRGLATIHASAMTIAGDAGGDAPSTTQAVMLSQAFFAVMRVWIAVEGQSTDAASLIVPTVSAASRLARLGAVDPTIQSLAKEITAAQVPNQVTWISTLCVTQTWCSRASAALMAAISKRTDGVSSSKPDNYAMHIYIVTYLIPGLFLIMSLIILYLQLRADHQVNDEIALSQDDREVSAHLVPAAHLGQLGLSSIAATGRFAEYDVKLAIVVHEFRYGDSIPFLGSADEEYLFFANHGAMITEVLGTGAIDKFTCGDCITGFFVSTDDAVNHVLNLSVRMKVTNVRRSSVDQEEINTNPTEMVCAVHYGTVRNSVQEVQQQRMLIRAGEALREARSMLKYTMDLQASITMSEAVKDSLNDCDAESRPIGLLPSSYKAEGCDEGALRMFEVYQVERLEVKQQRRSTRRMLDRAFRSGCSRDTRIQLLREATQAATNAGVLDEVAANLLRQAHASNEDTIENTPRTPRTGRDPGSPAYKPSSLFLVAGDSGIFNVQPPTPMGMSTHLPLFRAGTLAHGDPNGSPNSNEIPTQSFAEEDHEDLPLTPFHPHELPPSQTAQKESLEISKPLSPKTATNNAADEVDLTPKPPRENTSETPTTPPRLPDFEQHTGSPGPNTDKSEFDQSTEGNMTAKYDSLSVPKDGSKRLKREKSDKKDKTDKKEKRKKDKKERGSASSIDARSAVSEEVERR